jgi:hypothetical protein
MNPQCDCGIGEFSQRLGEVYREVESAEYHAIGLIRPSVEATIAMMMSDLSRSSCGVAARGRRCPDNRRPSDLCNPPPAGATRLSRILVTYSVSPGRTRLSVLGALILFLAPLYSAGATYRTGAPDSLRGAVVKLPVIDKQDIRFVQVSSQGESFQSRVTSIAQDRYGFLWLGTDDGLYRYDGYKLKPYRRERGNPNSLSDDAVRVVYRDHAGILWVGTGFGGLDRLDPSSDTFTHYRHDPANRGSLSANAVHCIYQDTGGALWVGTSGGLDRLDPLPPPRVHRSPRFREFDTQKVKSLPWGRESLIDVGCAEAWEDS